jgi:asparagine synthase (glutamine-hydrolysing)
MCGIAGAFSSDPTNDLRAVIEAIVEDQFSRGPDVQSVEDIASSWCNCALGHDRLSIIDLSAGANQPMWDNERRCCIVLNGEIYNYIELRSELAALGHSFITRSDTEVLLEAYKEWGEAALERLNGMFAFAIFDRDKRRLFLARDRFGVKPLLYHIDGDRVLFASSGRVIARRVGLGPYLDYVSRGLRYGIYDGEDVSQYDGLQALKPGHFLEFSVSDSGCLTSRLGRFYDLDARVSVLVDEIAAKSEAEMVESVFDLLENAVDIRFRADVPVAISLSAGLDSSSVAALSQCRDHGELTGFTFGHPNDAASEGPMVTELAKHTGIDVQFVRPGMSEIIKGYFTTIESQDAPFYGGSIVAQNLLYEAVRASGVRVLLGGQGGDEGFMGYRKFQMFEMKRLIASRHLLEAVGFFLSLWGMLVSEAWQTRAYWNRLAAYRGNDKPASALALPDASPVPMGTDVGEPLWKRQAREYAVTSLPTLLRYEDRNSMGHSVESRLPFMDYRLVELGLALPTAIKLRHGYGKWVVRAAVKDRIPDSIRLARYKRGFDIAQSAWISQGLGAAIRNALHERSSALKQWLAPGQSIDDLFSDAGLNRRTSAFAEATSLLWLSRA